MYIHFETAVSALNRHPQYRSPVKLLTDFSAPVKSDEFKKKLRFSHLVVKEGKWVLVQPKYSLPERWLVCKCNPKEILISCIKTATMRVSCPRRRWHLVLTPCLDTLCLALEGGDTKLGTCSCPKPQSLSASISVTAWKNKQLKWVTNGRNCWLITGD